MRPTPWARVLPAALIVLASVLAGVLQPALGQPVEGEWSTAFGPPGVLGETLDVIAIGDSVIVAGGFYVPGFDEPTSLALWDGSEWEPLADNVDGFIYSIAYDGAGALYVGGGFSTAGDVSAANVAVLDLATRMWSPLGSGVTDQVFDVAIVGGRVFFAGFFQEAGGMAANRLAAFDPVSQTWNGLGTADTAGFLSISAIGTYQGRLIAGGKISDIGGVRARNLAAYDVATATWSEFGGGVDNFILAITEGDGELYASGIFTEIGGVAADAMAAFDGSTWRSLTEEPADGVSGGSATGFVAPQQGPPSPTNPLLASGNASGSSTIDGVDVNGVAAWDGTAWSPVGASAPGPVSVANSGSEVRIARTRSGRVVAGATTVLLVGEESPPAYVRSYDGERWGLLGATDGAPDGPVSAVAIGEDGAQYVGGLFSFAGAVEARNVARRRDGAWEALGAGFPGPPSALVVRGTDVFAAVGTAVYLWDGTTWQPLPGPNSTFNDLVIAPDGVLHAATAGGVYRYESEWELVGGVSPSVSGSTRAILFGQSGELYAGGQYDTDGDGTPDASVRRLEDGEWQTVDPSPLLTWSLAMSPEGVLYAGKNSRLDRFEEGTWTTVGAPDQRPSGDFFALRFVDERLVAGGSFWPGPFAEKSLVSWDGAEWSDVAGGVGGEVYDLALSGRQLLLAGINLRPEPETPGGAPSGIAQLEIAVIDATSQPLPESPSLRVWPNPVATGYVHYATASEPLAVNVFDALGRRIASHVGGAREGSFDTSGWSPGLYVLQAVEELRSEAALFVVGR